MSSKAREALEAVYDCAKDGVLTIHESAFEKVLEALKEPLRNCDVGTPKEQIERWEDFCRAHHEYWKPNKSLTAIQRCNCPCHEGNGCNYFIWSQLPYEKGENDEC